MIIKFNKVILVIPSWSAELRGIRSAYGFRYFKIVGAHPGTSFSLRLRQNPSPVIASEPAVVGKRGNLFIFDAL
jgi:hypothetical protein